MSIAWDFERRAAPALRGAWQICGVGMGGALVLRLIDARAQQLRGIRARSTEARFCANRRRAVCAGGRAGPC